AHFPFATAQHLHLFRHDLGGVAILAAFLVLPLACLDAAFDINGTTLAQVFAGDLCKTVVEHDAVPFGFLAALARVAVFPLRGGGQRDITDRGALWRIPDFGIAAKVADENDFIDGGHIYTCTLKMGSA